MIIGVVGDTHNRISNVEKIIDIFNKSEVECVFHTGDITQAKTLRKFSRLKCPLYVVYGNNDLIIVNEKDEKFASYTNKKGHKKKKNSKHLILINVARKLI